MASNHTENLGLSQWAAEDIVKREDFNADNAKIDAALAEAAQIVLGTYEGDGEDSRFIELGFTPRALFVFGETGLFNYTDKGYIRVYGGFAMPEYPAWCFSIEEGGFRVTNSTPASIMFVQTNASGTIYRYLAIK